MYEYRCLDCDDVFQERRPVGEADTAACPAGHPRVKRLLSVFAAARTGGEPVPAGGGGGCCGGACGCG